MWVQRGAERRRADASKVAVACSGARCVCVCCNKIWPEKPAKNGAKKHFFLVFFVCKGARERPICTRAPFPWCLAKPCAPCLASMIRVSISRETAQGRSKTGEEVRPCVLGGIGPFSSERRATAPMTRRHASLRHRRICKMAAQKGSPGLQSVRRKNTRRKGEQSGHIATSAACARAKLRRPRTRGAGTLAAATAATGQALLPSEDVRVCTWRFSSRWPNLGKLF